MKAWGKEREKSVLHAPNFQKKKQKGLKSNKEDLGKHYWVEWQGGCGVRALEKEERHQVRIAKRKKKQ